MGSHQMRQGVKYEVIGDVSDWLEDVTKPRYVWYVKRLSGNDTLANGSHQAGPYIPKSLLFGVFPSLNRPQDRNPDKWFELYIDSHADSRTARVVWYNNKRHGGTRDEARITNLGGQESALLDPESTGALTIFAFDRGEELESHRCRVWVCQHETEEDLVEDRIGPVEPGNYFIWIPETGSSSLLLPSEKARSSCTLDASELPSAWLTSFPSGAEFVSKAIDMRPATSYDPDLRLIKRRDCEYEIFRSLENAVMLPRIRQGFSSVNEFIEVAQTILQRRKARSGRSLELHIRQIFAEEGLIEGQDFSYSPESEPGKRPDFLFPSEQVYKSMEASTRKLRMLAVKTTCKDRWRQVLNEADKISRKHLLTLQEGISERQFNEMVGAGVQLVVPKPIERHYHSSIRPHLQSLESFIADVRMLAY